MMDQARVILTGMINRKELTREELEEQHGTVWDVDELRRDFEVVGFGAPLVVVKRRSDGLEGTLWFQHEPRYYWGFEPS